MECLFTPHLSVSTSTLTLEGDEYIHAKALRLKESDPILITNGIGITAECRVTSINKRSLELTIEHLSEHTTSGYSSGIALGILDNRDRFELVIEKAVELGITDFYPLQTTFVQRKHTSSSPRWESKSIAALKQCKRAFKLQIHPVCSLLDVLNSTINATVVMADENGSIPSKINNDVIYLIGPEGGFSDEEKELIESRSNLVKWRLSDSRLRAETAALCCMAINAVL